MRDGIIPSKVKFTNDQIWNLEFLNFISGAYCYKKNDKGEIDSYAYVCSDYQKLIIIKKSDSLEYSKYEWLNNPNGQNESNSAICQFLSELAFGVLLKSGTQYEQKMSEFCWKLYLPQSETPEELILRINELMKK